MALSETMAAVPMLGLLSLGQAPAGSLPSEAEVRSRRQPALGGRGALEIMGGHLEPVGRGARRPQAG